MRKHERDDSFTDYVDARHKQLRRYAYVLTGDWAAADDLLQAVLTKLYVIWPRLKRSGGEDAYVRRMLVNGQIDSSRRAWNREAPTINIHESSAKPEPDVIERQLLVSALQELPAMQKRVVVLRFVFDLSVERCAEELGLSPNTVKSHTSRGVRHLRKLLSDSSNGRVK